MNQKVLVSCAVLCIISVCLGVKNMTLELSHQDSSTSDKTMESHSKEGSDLDGDSSLWQLWRSFQNWGPSPFNKKLTHSPFKKESEHCGRHGLHHNRPKVKSKSIRHNLLNTMFYLDSQRTTTRRDSSLISNRKNKDFDDISIYLGQPPALYNIESSTSMVPARPKGSVQKELVTLMFESMLGSIVESWETIMPEKREESYVNLDISKVPSETFTLSTGKKKKAVAKSSKTKRSRSKLTLTDNVQDSQMIWWSAPDEKAVIRFRNGNVYEGNISMKCMHGEGRLQWADGTVYLGQFKDNEICGKGIIQWKDDTWYEGEFMGNLRHGQGLYVNSRLQRSYTGGWHRGTKHGEGAIYYSKDFENSYDGGWLQNERFGYGSREYCASSGYKGEWERNIREGKGLMVWPNDDFYRGDWRNGVMSGHGIYIWEANYNNTMSVPSLKAYHGHWVKGQRNGHGVLSLGLGWGSYYKGDFVNNMKSGTGKFVTNNGLILQGKNLFVDDNLGSMSSNYSFYIQHPKGPVVEPYQFDICDSSVGLSYHVDQALRNLDKQQEIISNIVDDFIENNKAGRNKDVAIQARCVAAVKDEHREKEQKIKEHEELEYFQDLMIFEEDSLRKSLRCYETDLKNVYYKYATICNIEEIYFTPVMTRLYLWQLYYDCHIHEKGLTLYDIDIIFYQNPAWLARNPHDPFEKIYFWQFLHSLISVASKLYAKRKLPGPKPDTVLACAFRNFMEQDILPGCNQRRGRLVNGFGTFVPLKATYTLYRALGEPHTVRQFLKAVRRAPHIKYLPQPPVVEPPEECLPLGSNLYIFGDEMSFIVDDNLPEQEDNDSSLSIKLFNFANLSNKTIIKIFAKIFPQLCKDKHIMNLNIKFTFFEFFEAFVECAEESIKVKEEEMKLRNRIMSTGVSVAPHSSLIDIKAKIP